MKLYIDVGIAQSHMLLMDGDVPLDIYINDYNQKNTSGNIYKGRVENISSSLKCAFVNIGLEKNGLLHFSDCKNAPKKGDEVLVQVTREGVGDKGPRLSENLSIPSKNMVLLIEDCDINISKKIQNKKIRNDLFHIGKNLLLNEKDFGVIFRTSCQNLNNEMIEEEFNNLLLSAKKILSTWKYIRGCSKVFDATDFVEYIKREYITDKITDIYINSQDEYKSISSFIEENKFATKAHLVYDYQETMDIIIKSINKALNKSIETKSGNIIVDEVEAFSIIDVNYNKIEGNIRSDGSPLRGNLDACSFIASTIKLKNLSGIILIDFVNMDSENDNQKVIKRLNEEFFKYNVKATIHDFTKLSILEVTRAKKSLSLTNAIYKAGDKADIKGLYYLKNMEHDILVESQKHSKKDFLVYVSQDVYSCSEEIEFINNIRDKHKIKLTFKVLKDLKGYILDKDLNLEYARISIGSRSIFGTVLDLKEEGNNTSIKIQKTHTN